MFFVQTFAWPPNMHQKLTKHWRFYKQNNQLPLKSNDELEDINSSTIHFIVLDPTSLLQLSVRLMH